MGDVYRGLLGPLRASRLAAELPAGAAIYRGDDLDSKVYSTESALLRLWINMHLEPKHQLPTVEQAMKRAESQQRQKDKAERAAARARARAEAVERG